MLASSFQQVYCSQKKTDKNLCICFKIRFPITSASGKCSSWGIVIFMFLGDVLELQYILAFSSMLYNFYMMNVSRSRGGIMQMSKFKPRKLSKIYQLRSSVGTAFAMRCDAMRCDAMRCDAMRCDAMRCDAM